MFFKKNKIQFLFIFLFFIVGIVIIPQLVSAQASLGLEVPTGTGLGTRDLKDLIVTIVNILLGFLGLIAVIVILYSGYRWLTAGGNEENVSVAKKVLINGVIGLVIILSAFGIVAFVINIMGDATQEPGTACDPIGLTQP